MNLLEDLDEKVWMLIKAATENKDSRLLSRLNPVAEEIRGLKDQLQKLSHTVANFERQGMGEESMEGKSVLLDISEGALRNSYLMIGKAVKAHLVPEEGTFFEVETSDGQTFETDVISGRLRERGKIKTFYDKEKIKADDQVKWCELVPSKKYRVSKK